MVSSARYRTALKESYLYRSALGDLYGKHLLYEFLIALGFFPKLLAIKRDSIISSIADLKKYPERVFFKKPNLFNKRKREELNKRKHEG